MKTEKQGFSLVYPVTKAQFIREARHIERMARLSYQSEDKITATSYDEFIRRIGNRHETILEHGVMKVIFRSNIAILRELLRHRHISPTQESTRYCNYSKEQFGTAVSFIEPHWSEAIRRTPETYNNAVALWKEHAISTEETYFKLLNLGVTPEIARDSLTLDVASTVAITANFREWKYIFKMRGLNPDAHPQLRNLILPLYTRCAEKLPCVFDPGL
jgi:thymidylate synthase (FAD)